ncbi:MAG: D-alanyl-D-alanine carboxypeptidase [Bacilli bacterium]|nr:D-alanyl-D-alanine carboxypeptidase [Bacilli bacterium]
MKFKFIGMFLIIIIIVMIGLLVPKTNSDQMVNTVTLNDTSKSSIVLDLYNNEVLYENDAYRKMLPASLTKVLTAYVAYKYYDLNDFVVITHDMINVEGSKIYLEVGDVISVKDLIYGLLLCSGNDAALALAYKYSGELNDFIILMNEISKTIGMKDSNFENPHGLDGITNNYTTAYDLAILYSACYKIDFFKEVFKTKTYKSVNLEYKVLNFKNKHRLVHSEPNCLGGKTGYTKKAGRTLITGFEDKFNQLVVVSLDAYSDWDLHKRLSSYGFSQIRRRF